MRSAELEAIATQLRELGTLLQAGGMVMSIVERVEALTPEVNRQRKNSDADAVQRELLTAAMRTMIHLHPAGTAKLMEGCFRAAEDLQGRGVDATWRELFRIGAPSDMADAGRRLVVVADSLCAQPAGISRFETLDLTPQEQRLVDYMAGRQRVTFEELKERVWGSDVENEAIEKAIQRLNKKLIDRPERFAIKAGSVVKE